MIHDNTIKLFPDHTENNIHFIYKDIEVDSHLNPSYLNKDKYKRITQIYEDNNKFEFVEDDYTREIHINVQIDKYLALIDDLDDDFNDDEELDIEISEDENDDDDCESFDDKLKRHFPSQYLSNNQIKGYEKGNQRKPILEIMMDIEEDNIYSFVSIWGLSIKNDYMKFWAPVRSKSEYEWIYWAITIIDKFLDIFNDDEEDNENELEDE